MRSMFDGIEPGTVPAGADIYAGYDDGDWQSFAGLTAAYPGKLYVSICVTASGSARVLDIESGDAIPEEAPGWAATERASGNLYPVCYMNESTWPAVKAAFAAQNVAPPLYWVAAYVDDPTTPPAALPDGAIALQYYDFGGYDASIAADYWPGLDPAPATSPTAVLEEEDPMQIEPLSVHPGEYAIAFAPDKTEMVLVADGYDDAPAQLRVAFWNQNNPLVMPSLEIGGSSKVHTVGHPMAAGTTGVTIRRLDGQDYPVGIAFS